MEIAQGNTMENSGKQNPKMGFKSPSEQRRNLAGHNQPVVMPLVTPVIAGSHSGADMVRLMASASRSM
jgi:hypothetical protein